MNSWVLNFFFFSLVGAFLGLSADASAMTGGAYSTDPRYAAIVKIQTSFGPDVNRGNCGGVFITPRHLLTAAHCVLTNEIEGGMTPISIRWVQFPSKDIFMSGTQMDIPHVKFHFHPGYLKNRKPGNPFDIAIVEFKYTVATHTLPLSTSSVKAGNEILVGGYGCDKATKDWATNFKMARKTVESSKEFLNLSNSSAKFCVGDSGTGALIETSKGLRVVGVNSYMNVFKGALGGSRDRIAKVESALPWIQSILHP